MEDSDNRETNGATANTDTLQGESAALNKEQKQRNRKKNNKHCDNSTGAHDYNNYFTDEEIPQWNPLNYLYSFNDYLVADRTSCGLIDHPYLCCICNGFKSEPVYCPECQYSYCSRECMLLDQPLHKIACNLFGQECCAKCKAPSPELKKCFGCKKVKYCSKDCQRADWKDHKTSCKTSKTEDEKNSTKEFVEERCAKCKAPSPELKKCFGCKKVKYCSKDCQRADWKDHKTSCKTSKTEDEKNSTKEFVEERCAKCKAPSPELKKCFGCKKVKYCSKDCQRADWKDHKTSCKTSKTEDEKNSTKEFVEERCAKCKAPSPELKKCFGCKKVKYCSKDCQRADWKDHKTSCKTSKTEDEKNSTKEFVEERCAKCKAPSPELKKCFGCKKVKYCSKDCQRADWKDHKTSCKTSKTEDEKNSTKEFVEECCAKCKAPSPELKKCFGCKKVKYCSKDCQRADWKDHKTSCKTSKTEDEKNSTKEFVEGLYPMPENVIRETRKMFPFQSVLTKFYDLTTFDNKFEEEKLVAYIYENGNHICRIHFKIRDICGKILNVFFYHKELMSQPYFTWDQLKVGNYIIIIRPQFHHFTDGSFGFRINFLKDIRIIDN